METSKTVERLTTQLRDQLDVTADLRRQLEEANAGRDSLMEHLTDVRRENERLAKENVAVNVKAAEISRDCDALREAAREVLKGGGYLHGGPGIPAGHYENIIPNDAWARLRAALDGKG